MVSDRQAVLLLAVFTVSRTCVSFQFQSLTPLVDMLRESLHIGATGFGLLLGLYMAPGAVMAVVLPLLTRRLGDRNTVLFALVLMVIGQLVLVQARLDYIAYGARLLAGIGGCIVYIATIDLAAKYCRAGELPGRMGMVATSWPFGNAISLIVVGLLVSWEWTVAAAYVPAGLALIALMLIVATRTTFSSAHKEHQAHHATPAMQPSLWRLVGSWRHALMLCWLPGLTFALYNIGFIIFVSFSSQLLTAQGYSSSAASGIASLPMWLFVISVPLGGVLAGLSRRWAHALVAFGCLGGALCIGASYVFEAKVFWYVAAGICGGLPTGPMLSKVGRRDHLLFYPAIFFIFFVALLVVPPLVGMAMDYLQDQRSAIAMAMALVVSGWLLFIPSVRRPKVNRAECP